MATLDLSVRKICKHQVKKEKQAIEPDGKTIRLDRPVSSKSSIKLYINGYEIPKNQYSVVEDELGVTLDKVKIVLKNPRKSYLDDVVEIDYNTTVSNCRMCHGRGELDDLNTSTAKSLIFISDRDKLRQDIDKIIVTVLNSNPFHQWYGTLLTEYIGKKISNLDRLRRRITIEVQDALEKLKDLQRQQETYQSLSDGEVLLRFEGLDVMIHGQNTIKIDFTVMTRELDMLKVSQVYRF